MQLGKKKNSETWPKSGFSLGPSNLHNLSNLLINA